MLKMTYWPRFLLNIMLCKSQHGEKISKHKNKAFCHDCIILLSLYQIEENAIVFVTWAMWLKTALASFTLLSHIDHLQYFKGKCVQQSLSI